MKFVLYSKSKFVRFDAHSKNWITAIGGIFIELQEVLNDKFKNNVDFRNEFLLDMEQGNGIFTAKRTRDIWSSILTTSFDADYVLINIDCPKSLLDVLLEVAKSLKVEFELAINLFLDKEFMVPAAEKFLETYESEEPVPAAENIQMILNDEQKRGVLFSEMTKGMKVINIKSDCSPNEIANKILAGIERA